MASPEPEQFQITYAPGVLSAIQGDREQRNATERGGYRYFLGDMDLAQGEMARLATFRAEIDHTHPAGHLVFKSQEDRLAAIRAIHEMFPDKLGWKWREKLQPLSGTEMTDSDWVQAMRKQPFAIEYLKGTSEDPSL